MAQPTLEMKHVLANLFFALLPPSRHTVNRHAVIRCSAPPPIPSVDVKALRVGTIVAGRVLGVGEDGSYELDIGTGSPATMPRSESALLPNATRGRVPGQGVWPAPGFSQPAASDASPPPR